MQLPLQKQLLVVVLCFYLHVRHVSTFSVLRASEWAGKAPKGSALSLGQKPEDEVEKTVRDQIERDAKKTRKTLGKMKGFEEATNNNLENLWQAFLSGLHFDRYRVMAVWSVFCISLIWFIIYFRYISAPDRHRRPEQCVCANHNPLGEVAFVFDHPLGPKAEQDKITGVDPEVLMASLSVHKQFAEYYPRLHQLLTDACATQDDSPRDASFTISPRDSGSESDGIAGVKREVEVIEREVKEEIQRDVRRLDSLASVFRGSGKTIMIYDVKVAMVQDIIEMFDRMHFEVKVFSSIDVDEIYVCVAMEDEAMVNDYLEHYDSEVKMRADLIQKMHIKYPDVIEEKDIYMYDPPFMRFDPKGVVNTLHRAKVIAAPDPKLVYDFNEHMADEDSFMGTKERVRHLYKRICHFGDPNHFVEQGLMLAWFPLHNRDRADKMTKKWASFHLLTDLSFFQPLHALFDYFGASIAFSIAFNGAYTKALLGLAPIAIIISMLTLMSYFYGSRHDVETNLLGIGFSLTLVAWSRIASNLWRQEQAFCIEDWNMGALNNGNVLPKFRGELRPSAVDLNVEERYFPAHYLVMWQCFTTAIVLLFCTIVGFSTYMWDFMFDGQVTLVGSILLAIQIKVLEFIFCYLALYLNERENHQYIQGWTDSLIWKKFIFYAVNSYYPFFYLTVIQGAVEDRCPGDCVILLRWKLTSTMAVLTILRIVQVVLAGMILDFKVKYESWQLRRSGNYAPDEALPEASYAERQAKADDYSVDAQVDTMIQRVIPLGFVLLFGTTAPATVLFATILFAVDIRATGTLLLTSVRRPQPHRSRGIGAWQDVNRLLMMLGVFANGFYLVQYGGLFRDTPLLTKLSGIMIFCCVGHLMWKAIDLLLPEEGADVQMLKKRRKHVMNKISHLSAFHPEQSKEFGMKKTPSSRASTLTPRTPREIENDACAEQGDMAIALAGNWEDVGLFPDAKCAPGHSDKGSPSKGSP